MKINKKTKNRLLKFRESSTYSEYRQYIETLKKLKDELNELVKEKGEVCTKYQKYLDKNPHKEERKELIRKVKKKRKTIMGLI